MDKIRLTYTETHVKNGKVVRNDITDQLEPDQYTKLLTSLQEAIYEVKRQCPHKINTPKKLDNLGNFATCSICQQSFGWWCNESPDNVCHYFSTKKDGKRGVPLINGTFHPLPEDYDDEYETDDECIFCGMPDERK